MNPHLEKIPALIEKEAGIKLPRQALSISLTDRVLHTRFAHPHAREAEVEPPPLKTPIYLFRDEETRKPTTLEILDIDQLTRRGKAVRDSSENNTKEIARQI